MSPRILCIEDNPVNYRLVQRLLGQAGYEMHWAEDGLKGFEMALELKPELLLLDINLPGLSGFEVAAKFRQHAELKQTPIVALTAKTQKSDRDTALVAGCDGFIPKPIDPFTFVRQVEGYLGGRRERLDESREGAVLRGFNLQMLEHLEAQLKQAQEANRKLTATQQALEARNQSLQRLVDLGQSLLLEHDPTALVLRVLEQIQAMVGAKTLAAYRLHSSGGYWEGFRWQGARFEAAPTLPQDHAFCLCLRTLSGSGLLHGAQLRNHRIWEEGLALAFWEPASEMSLQVLRDRQAEDEIWGFWTFAREEAHPFLALDLELIALHAGLARVSIENAELIHNLHESTRALASSYEHMELSYQELQNAKAELSRQDRQVLLEDLFGKITHRLVAPVQTLNRRSQELNSLVGSRGSLELQAPKAISEMQGAVAKIDGLMKALMRRVGEDGPSAPEWLDLHDLLLQELELMGAEGAIPSGVEVETELAALSPRLLGVYGDFSKLLQNLVLHACGGPSPSSRLRLRTWTESGCFHLEILDEGGPIPPTELAEAFEPFTELHQQSVIGIRGPGASLPLCRQLLTAYHGEIGIRNEGEGTAVHVSFPLG